MRITRRYKAKLGAAILAGGMAFTGSVSAVDLIQNGSFEQNNGFNANNSGFGWTTIAGADTTLGFDVYSHVPGNGQVYYAGPAPAGAGDWYFHTVGLGTLGPDTAIVEQIVDMTGQVGKAYDFNAQIAGYLAGGDTSRLELSFWDAAGGAGGAGTQLGTTNVLDGTTGGADGITNTWDLFSATGTVPTGTVSASVRIFQAGANGNDNYTDLVRLDVVSGSDSKLILTVDKNSGAASVSMPGDAVFGDRDINFYEVGSASSLLTTTTWNSFSDQGIDPVDDGQDSGETWDEAGGSSSALLSEAFLLGSSNFAPSRTEGLGVIYTGGSGGAEDVIFRYGLTDNTLIDGIVVYGTVTNPCDFEPDGDCDVDDLDSLTLVGNLTTGVAVPPAEAKFDLDASSTVNTADLNKWLADAASVNGHASPYIPGDNDLDRDVDITDFNVLATAFDPGGINSATNKWSVGDGDGDGDVDITDFNVLATNFSPGGYDGATAAVAADADPGQVDLVVDVETGEVTLDGNNAAISGLQVFSAGNSLLATDFTADVLQFVISTNTSTYAEGAFANMGVDGLISLGMMYDALVDARDVTFEYTMIGQPTVQGRVHYIPEPASLVLMGMGGMLVLRRRR